MKFLDRLDRLLKARGLTQKGVAEAAGLAPNRISKWKDNVGEPTAAQALAIARVLGVPVGWLIDPDAPDEPPAPAPAPAPAGAPAGAAPPGLPYEQIALYAVFKTYGLDLETAVRRLEGAGPPAAAQDAVKPGPGSESGAGPGPGSDAGRAPPQRG